MAMQRRPSQAPLPIAYGVPAASGGRYHARGDQRIGISNVALKDERGVIWRSGERLPSCATLMGEAIGLKALPFWPTARMCDRDHTPDRSVGRVIGAHYLLRHEAFAPLGGFDERFLYYCEDIDLALRAQRAGWDLCFRAAPRSLQCLARGALADLRFTWQGFGMLARELPAVLRAARAR